MSWKSKVPHNNYKPVEIKWTFKSIATDLQISAFIQESAWCNLKWNYKEYNFHILFHRLNTFVVFDFVSIRLRLDFKDSWGFLCRPVVKLNQLLYFLWPHLKDFDLVWVDLAFLCSVTISLAGSPFVSKSFWPISSIKLDQSARLYESQNHENQIKM